ncbi:hypothetical protein ACRAWD_18970 [Caulobacter segnis]
MKSFVIGGLAALLLVGGASAQDMQTAAKPGAPEPPLEWVDKTTGHRIVRLSREPGSSSLYFNYNSYTPKGDRLVFASPTGITAMDLKTRVLSKIVEGKVRLLFVGRKTGAVYYEKALTADPMGPKAVMAVDPYTKATREVAKMIADPFRPSTPTRPCWPASPSAPTCRSRRTWRTRCPRTPTT